MNGVDRADQLCVAYVTGRKSLKWWKYLFYYLLDIAVCNAYVLMKESPNHQMTTKKNKVKIRSQLEFRMALAHQMIGDFRVKRKRVSTTSTMTRGLLHWPAALKKRLTCKWCTKKGKRKETKFGCEDCQVNMCVECFKAYHREHFPELFQS
jgi:hypothetical protein